MILLEDIIDPWRRLLGRKGEKVTLIADHSGVLIVENEKGNRLPVNKIKISMKQEFQMTKEEMAEIIRINKEGGDPVMYVSGGIPLGKSLAEKINDYWGELGKKYKFWPLTAEASPNGNLFFLAEPI